MSNLVETVSNQPNTQTSSPSEDDLRVVGALFANGPVASSPQNQGQREAQRFPVAPPSSRALANVPAPSHGKPSGMERAMNAFRIALPFVQRVLPLLDGNVATAVSNILIPQAKAPAPAPVDLTPILAPIQDGLADLRVQNRTLRDQVAEQNVSLKRVGDQLQQVREATDRNTLEQQELLQDLKSVGSKVNVFAFIALALLGVSVVLNVVLYLQIRHIIP
jgi:hypothetical protein